MLKSFSPASLIRHVAEYRLALDTVKVLGLEQLWCSYQGLKAPIKAFCQPVTISFLCDLCPLRHLWASITFVCIVGMPGPSRV